MRLRKVFVSNVRSFLKSAQFDLPGDISIIIGPNGGGKTNLLDITTNVLRKHLLLSTSVRKFPAPENPERHEFVPNHSLQNMTLEPHHQSKSNEQVIKLTIEVTKRDIENITSMKQFAISNATWAEKKYVGHSIRVAADWDVTILREGQLFEYTISNDNLQQHNDLSAILFQRYLALYEVDAWLRLDRDTSSLSTPMLNMPVNRTSGGVQSNVTLSGYDESGLKLNVDAASSRLAASTMSLAVGKIARMYRLLECNGDGNARRKLSEVPFISSLSAALKELGYSWDIICTDPMINSYDIQLEKQGIRFLAGNASSGEKELLTYIFAIYALNVRDALIVIDEPELHLHPRWQKTLLGLFERLSSETGNQFILATHSPVFVSPSSIQYVSRVYSANQESTIVRLANSELPARKHLFGIVNSQNNERMFFADKVVLVEGISDRIFFESVFRHLWLKSSVTIPTLEFVSVGGKSFFKPYETILKACKVPYFIIADRDYLREIGTAEIKHLFSINNAEIAEKVIDDHTSKDGEVLVKMLGEAISSGSMDHLRIVWGYITDRRCKLNHKLSQHELDIVKKFIESQRNNNVFVLSMGALEAYLPKGYLSKDLEKLISLLETDIWAQLPSDSKEELEMIFNQINSSSGSDGLDGI